MKAVIVHLVLHQVAAVLLDVVSARQIQCRVQPDVLTIFLLLHVQCRLATLTQAVVILIQARDQLVWVLDTATVFLKDSLNSSANVSRFESCPLIAATIP